MTLTLNFEHSEQARTTNYIGRFAPSPSGPLHFGSLVCALASYLDARKNGGKWLVRIEDIDPPREQAGADQTILNCLYRHSLFWDDTPLYQSSRSDTYLNALKQLDRQGLTYRCTCNRKRLSALNHRYDGRCRDVSPPTSAPAAVRLNTALMPECTLDVEDEIQGKVSENFCDSGDFVIHRKDGLFAYQLAVTVDDTEQNITHVVRGCDLLDSTPKQALLFDIFGAQRPIYAHIPIIIDNNGNKLSKQNHARSIDENQAFSNLLAACKALALSPPDRLNVVSALLNWAIDDWNPDRLKNQKQIFVADSRLV